MNIDLMKTPANEAATPASVALSVVIPTLNEEHTIGPTLAALGRVRGALEVIVVDGGSHDETIAAARAAGARVLAAAGGSGRGRGAQMHAGACAARGAALWFLHADTHASADAAELIAEALSDAAVVGGNFHVRFDGPLPAARFLTWLYPRLRRLGLSYGDSAFFVRRAAYEQTGGFQPYPLFEDVDLARRLRRHGRFVHLPREVVTSSRRFEGRSFALTFARWSILQGLYWLGVHPRMLCRLYAPVRVAKGKGRQRRGIE